MYKHGLKQDLVIVEQQEVAERIYQVWVEGTSVESMTQPGQFVHLRVSKEGTHLLRRPISICDVDLDKRRMSMIYRVEGAGTQALAQLKAGDTVDVLGPLGQGFPLQHLNRGDKALLVGGGVGVPPLYYLSKKLVEKGVQVTHVLGYQSKAHSFLVAQFEQLGETHVTTMDGSLGVKGLVTDVSDKWPKTQWAGVYTCGPLPMLKALQERYRSHPHAYLSLEERMGCGIGACFACVCHTPGEEHDYRKICSDGPVFHAEEVVL